MASTTGAFKTRTHSLLPALEARSAAVLPSMSRNPLSAPACKRTLMHSIPAEARSGDFRAGRSRSSDFSFDLEYFPHPDTFSATPLGPYRKDDSVVMLRLSSEVLRDRQASGARRMYKGFC